VLFCNGPVEWLAQMLAPPGTVGPPPSVLPTGSLLSRWCSSERAIYNSDVSVIEALKHCRVAVQVLRLDAEQITAENIAEKLGRADTFVVRESSATARLNQALVLRLCRETQLAVVKFAGANRIKCDTKTNDPGMPVSYRDWESCSDDQQDGKDL
jgi:hypothetical protein